MKVYLWSLQKKFTSTVPDLFNNCIWSNTTYGETCSEVLLDHYVKVSNSENVFIQRNAFSDSNKQLDRSFTWELHLHLTCRLSNSLRELLYLQYSIATVSFQFFLSIICSTLPIPAGMFISAFVLGAAFGRTIGIPTVVIDWLLIVIQAKSWQSVWMVKSNRAERCSHSIPECTLLLVRATFHILLKKELFNYGVPGRRFSLQVQQRSLAQSPIPYPCVLLSSKSQARSLHYSRSWWGRRFEYGRAPQTHDFSDIRHHRCHRMLVSAAVHLRFCH